MEAMGIGLIGLGRHGMRYARHLLGDVPHAHLAAVCRRKAEAGSQFGAEHGIRFYQDYRALVADGRVNAVVVVTPPSVTRTIGLEAIRAGKPVLIEKPLASIGVEAKEIVSAAESSKVPLMTAQTLRFETAVKALKEEIPGLGAGKYMALTARMEPRTEAQDSAGYGGRGILLEIGIHLLDLIRFLTGDEVVEVRCEMDGCPPERPEVRAWASLRTSGGLSCVLDVSRMAPGRVGRAEWVGEHGQVVADWTNHRVTRILSGNRLDEYRVENKATIVSTLEAFVGALRAKGSMTITGLDGQRAVEIADACYLSAEIGRPVRLEHR